MRTSTSRCKDLTQPLECSTVVTFLPCISTTSIHINRMLVRHNVRFVSLLPEKISSFCHLVKDDLGQKNCDMYGIPYSCHMKERHWHVRRTWPDKSAVAEHSFRVWSTTFIFGTPQYSPLPCYVREVTPDTVTRRMGWC
jgi:hypothetical protein